MSGLLLSSGRLRRGLRAAVLPFCVGLLLAGLPATMLPSTHAQGLNRIKAPDFDGAVGTIGSDKPIKLANLRGKIVVLEFWTLC